jgi:hypothetical protein
MEQFLYVSLIITSIALVFSIILQSKGAGLGGLTGTDTGSVFTARRGVENLVLGDDLVQRPVLHPGDHRRDRRQRLTEFSDGKGHRRQVAERAGEAFLR